MGNTGNSGEAHPRGSASPFIAARNSARRANPLTIVAICEPPKVDFIESSHHAAEMRLERQHGSVKNANWFPFGGRGAHGSYLTPLQQVIDINQ
jgi:hypothetical protein